jgi:PAS domain S-box-containing protein
MNKKNSKGIEGKARILLNLLTDMAVIVDSEGNVLLANDIFEEVTGLSRKKLIGTAFLKHDILAAESKPILMENLKARIRGDQVDPYDIHFTSRTGEDRCAEVKGKRIIYAGQPADLAVFHDVTRRRRNELQLKEYAERMEALVEEKVREIMESEAKFRGITDSALDAMFMFDEQDRIAYWNPAAERIFGYTEEEIVGKQVGAMLMPSRFCNVHLKLMEELANDNAKAQTCKIWEFPALKKSGAEFSMELSLAPLQLNHKTYFIAVARDVTDRRKAEATVKEAEQRYSQLFHTIPSGVAVYEQVDDGEDFIFVDFNQAAEKIEKTPKEAILGRRVSQVFPGVKELGLFDVFKRVYRTGKEEYLPSRIYRDGRMLGWRENWVYKLPNGNIVSVYNDVTEKKQAEENLRTSEEKLRGIFETSPDPIVVTALDSKILDCNPLRLQSSLTPQNAR